MRTDTRIQGLSGSRRSSENACLEVMSRKAPDDHSPEKQEIAGYRGVAMQPGCELHGGACHGQVVPGAVLVGRPNLPKEVVRAPCRSWRFIVGCPSETIKGKRRR